MSKGQKKGNKELKKPKQEKRIVIPASTSILPSMRQTKLPTPKS